MPRYDVKVTKSGTVERSYHCRKCDIRALATVQVQASGSTVVSASSGYVYDASKRANDEFARRSVDVLGLAPCPRCQDRNGIGAMKLGVALASFFCAAGAVLVWMLRETILMVAPLVVLGWAVSRLYRWWYLWQAAPRVSFEDIRPGRAEPLPRARALR